MAELPTTNNSVTPQKRAQLDSLARGKKPDIFGMIGSQIGQQNPALNILGSILGLGVDRTGKTKEYVAPSVAAPTIAPDARKAARRAAILTGEEDDANIYVPKLGA